MEGTAEVGGNMITEEQLKEWDRVDPKWCAEECDDASRKIHALIAEVRRLKKVTHRSICIRMFGKYVADLLFPKSTDQETVGVS